MVFGGLWNDRHFPFGRNFRFRTWNGDRKWILLLPNGAWLFHRIFRRGLCPTPTLLQI